MTFDTGDNFRKPEWPTLSSADLSTVIKFIEKGFGASEWVGLHGGSSMYYFNLDKAYSNPEDGTLAKQFHDVVAKFLTNGLRMKEFSSLLNGNKPVLAYICPENAPVGIAQARGALAERLGWPSVLVFPEKRLLRSRVITGGDERDFPASTAWLAGRQAFLLCDAATTGESVARGTGALRAFGCSSMAAIAIFNRDEGAEESLALLNLPLFGIVDPKPAQEQFSDRVLAKNICPDASRKIVRDYSIHVGQSS